MYICITKLIQMIICQIKLNFGGGLLSWGVDNFPEFHVLKAWSSGVVLLEVNGTF
jgi:hypothetical protein